MTVSTPTILVVDDDDALAEMIGIVLAQEGYNAQFCENGARAFEVFMRYSPDLVLLDLMLPGKNGIEVCEQIRASSNVPIIMLTAKDTELDKVLGLELGADDYVTKPYSSRELIARIRAVLRRRSGGDPEEDESRAPLVATITGSSTSRPNGLPTSFSATHSITSAVPSMPILKAAT